MQTFMLVSFGFWIGANVSAWMSVYKGPCPPRALAYGTVAAAVSVVGIICYGLGI